MPMVGATEGQGGTGEGQGGASEGLAYRRR